MAFGATTNKLDNILNTGTFQRPTGAGVGNIWTSDAAGFGTWAVPAVASGPFAVTNASNFFTIASTNTFNALTVSSNHLARGYSMVNGTNVTTGVYSLLVRPAPGTTSAFIQVDEIGLGGSAGIEFKRGARLFEFGNDGADNLRAVMQGSGSFIIRDDAVNIFSANDSGVTIGATSSSTETHLGITDTRPNGWLVNGFAPATVIVTNVQANFPSILAANFADLTFPVSNTSSNMVISIGRPTTEDGSLAVNAFISAIGTVTLRARNVGGIAVDQADLPYRIQITASPTANSP